MFPDPQTREAHSEDDKGKSDATLFFHTSLFLISNWFLSKSPSFEFGFTKSLIALFPLCSTSQVNFLCHFRQI
jgi:hypothetical protein